MAVSAPSYTFYKNTYKGTVQEDEYNALSSWAAAHVDYLIGYKTVGSADETAVSMAVCACVDAFADYGTDGIGGFSIGSFSMSSSEAITGKQIATDACWEYLAPTGLLFGGILL